MIGQTEALLYNLIEERIAMKQFGIKISNVRLKDGKLEKVSKAPPHVKMAQRKSKKVRPVRKTP